MQIEIKKEGEIVTVPTHLKMPGPMMEMEDQIQEAEEKMPKLKGVKKHFIGHLQSNKARKAVELFDVIQSVDSLKLAKKISDACVDLQKTIEVMIEVMMSEVMMIEAMMIEAMMMK